MTRRSSDAQALTAEIAGIVTMPGKAVDRAQALLEPLRRITPCDSVLITVFDTARRRHVPLLRHGFDGMRQYIHTAAALADLERTGVHRRRLPMRLVDLPMPALELPIWAEHLYPAGFREGLGTGLFTGDGRHLGLVSVNTADPRPPSEQSRLLLHQLRPLIAAAVDPLRDAATVAGVVADAVAGVVCTAGGETVALPGLPSHPLLAAGSPALTAARAQLADGRVHAAFLCPPDDTDTDAAPDQLYRVTALACPPGPLEYLRAVVLLSPPPRLYGLTRRELEVLGLLVQGWTNARIAAALQVTGRTVAAHVEHIMVKLGAASRTMAAVRGLGQGLYIPPELTADLRGRDPPGDSGISA